MDRRVGGSFRDPSGFVFRRDDRLFRQVNECYRADYDHLITSGLYARLTEEGLLIPHAELGADEASSSLAYQVLEPEPIGLVSYPYEWCFSQLKDAALATLRIQKLAFERGMTLKDASSYNVQFRGAHPVFIDTLSFERYVDGSPWVGYRQFCQHFLAPLALMAYVDVRLSSLLRTNIDGIPLDLASKLLPARTKLKPSLAMHIHMHAQSQLRNASEGARVDANVANKRMSETGLKGLVDSLTGAVEGLSWVPKGDWADYYNETNYTDDSFELKRAIVAEFLEEAAPEAVWDLGANTGLFSRIASEGGISTVAWDLDPAAVEANYQQCRRQGTENLLPLVADLANPSPSIGWAGEERDSLEQRGPVDTVLALALIHHLAIGNNLPLERVADYFARLGRNLIIEFVPKEDSQVQRMLRTREDVFPNYDKAGFEATFESAFTIESRRSVTGSERTMYLMRRR